MNDHLPHIDCLKFIESEWRSGLNGHNPKIADFDRNFGCAAAAAYHLESHLVLPGRVLEGMGDGEAWIVFDDLLATVPREFASQLARIVADVSSTAKDLAVIVDSLLQSPLAQKVKFPTFNTYFATLLVGCNLLRQEINSAASRLESNANLPVVFIGDNFVDGFPQEWTAVAAPNLSRTFASSLGAACSIYIASVGSEPSSL